MHIGFIGSRDFSDRVLATHVVSFFQNRFGNFTCVSGGAKGADTICADICEQLTKQKPLIFIPDWKQFGRAAGMIRNREIVDNSEILIAFWDGKSKGTKDSINYSRKQNKPLLTIKYNDFDKPRDLLNILK